MALLADMLRKLEGCDTLHADQALRKILSQDAEGWPPEAIIPLSNSLSEIQPLVEWMETRLVHWHSFKVNALQAAWQKDPVRTLGAEMDSQERITALVREILISLRQGIVDNPQLGPDGMTLQQLACEGHSFAWSQAYKEVQADAAHAGESLDNETVVFYCKVAAHSFRFLFTDPE